MSSTNHSPCLLQIACRHTSCRPSSCRTNGARLLVRGLVKRPGRARPNRLSNSTLEFHQTTYQKPYPIRFTSGAQRCWQNWSRLFHPSSLRVAWSPSHSIRALTSPPCAASLLCFLAAPSLFKSEYCMTTSRARAHRRAIRR